MGKKGDQKGHLTPWQRAVQQTHKQEAGPSQPKRHLLADFQIQNLQRMWPLLVGLVVIIGVMIFFVSPISKVQKVTISGNEIVSVKQIKHFSPVKKGTPLLSVWGKRKSLAASLKKRSQRMASVKMTLPSFNTVHIQVEEYPTIGYLYRDRGYQPILKSGVIIKNKVLNPRDGFPILRKFQNPAKLRRTIRQYRRIDPPVRAAINTISYSPVKSNQDRVFIQMNDGNRVYASISSFGDKMDYYPSINAKLKTKSVINLEVGAYSYPITKSPSKSTVKSKTSY